MLNILKIAKKALKKKLDKNMPSIYKMSGVVPEWLKEKISQKSSLVNIDNLDLPSSLKIKQNTKTSLQKGGGNQELKSFSEKIKLEYKEISEKYQH